MFLIKLFSLIALLFFLTPDNNPKSGGEKQPFVFGVLADIQYADKDNRNRRHYRSSLKMLEAAVTDFNSRKPSFVIQLGDIVDGHSGEEARSITDLNSVLDIWKKLNMPAYHVLGNHCRSVGQEALENSLGFESFYYDFSFPEAKEWHFIVLDGNDAGYGVIGDKQLAWFESRLKLASDKGKKVIVFCHYALLEGAAKSHRMATPEPILRILDENKVVSAWFSGHDHAGGYELRNRVHHISLKGMVESPINNAYAIVELHENLIRIIGFGDELSRDLLIAE